MEKQKTDPNPSPRKINTQKDEETVHEINSRQLVSISWHPVSLQHPKLFLHCLCPDFIIFGLITACLTFVIVASGQYLYHLQ